MPQKDALDLLKEDHDQVRNRLQQLVHTDDVEERRELLPRIKRDIQVHAKLEEELFYPAFEKAAETKESHVTVLESHEEHGLADKVLEELEQADPGSDEFLAKAKVLQEVVEQHIRSEEDGMLPQARRVMKIRRLQALHDDMASRKQELKNEYDQKIEARQ